MAHYLISCWTLASFSATVMSAAIWPAMPDWIWGGLNAGLLVVSIWIRVLRIGWGINAGLLLVMLHGHLIHQQIETLFRAGPDITINAKADSFFKQISHGFRGEIVVRSINGQTLRSLMPLKVQFISPIALLPGDEIDVKVRLEPVVGLLNEVGFDAEKQALSRRWLATAVAPEKAHFIVRSLPTLRAHYYLLLERAIAPYSQRGLIEALTFGARHHLSTEQSAQLARSGLGHLIAISGLHIGIAFGLGWWLGRGVFMLWPRANVAPLILGLIVATCYAWLAGLTLPTQRALLACLLTVGLLVVKRYWPLRLKWCLVTAILLLFDPFAPLSLSFWMSILAVAIIFVFVSSRYAQTGALGGMLRLQVFFLLFMTPLTILFFDGVSRIAFLTNLVCVPLFSFIIIPLTLLALLAQLLFDFSLLWPLINGLLQWVSDALGHWDLWWWVADDWAMLFGVSALLALASVWVRKRVLLLIFAVTAMGRIEFDPKPLWEMWMLDVGHGLAVVIRQGESALVYDTGSAWQDSSYAEQVITPLLYKRGIRRVDYLILSHMDWDHAGGWQPLVAEWQPTLISSQHGVGDVPCRQGQTLQWQRLTLEVLWPPTKVSRAFNPHSCVIRVNSPEASVLLTGDIDAIAEWLLLREPQHLKADILLVPHHGSRTSSLPAFIDAVSPRLALASSAYRGRWTLPHPLVVERYQTRGIDRRDTGTFGQLTVKFYPNEWFVRGIREVKGRAWYRQMLRNGVE